MAHPGRIDAAVVILLADVGPAVFVVSYHFDMVAAFGDHERPAADEFLVGVTAQLSGVAGALVALLAVVVVMIFPQWWMRSSIPRAYRVQGRRAPGAVSARWW